MASERPYELTLAPEFEAEADKASDWWAKHRPAAPHLFEDELDAALLRISARPEIGKRARSRKVGDARFVTLLRSGYLIFYRVDPVRREVQVVHLRHGHRRPLKLR